MSDGWQARFTDEPRFATDEVRLLLRERFGGASGRWLTSTGGWIAYRAGVEPADQTEVGLVIPREAVEAIAAACEAYLGHATHAATEAAVLRESLAVERGRVDRVLAGRLER